MVGLEGTVRDVVHAMRLAIKRPGFSAAVVLTLAVGIGGNTAVFNLVDTVVLSRLPYEDSENLYSVFERDAAGGRRLPSYPTFEDWEDRSQVFDGLAFARGAPLTYRTDDQAGLLLGAFVSEAFFGTLGVPAVLGRALLQDDYLPDAEAATVLSYRAWTSWFGADPQIIGTTIVLEDRPFTVVGVMSNDFAFPDWGADNDLWMPIVRLPPADYAALMQRGFHADSRVVARLAGDVTPARAQAEIGALAQALADNYPETNGGWTRVSFEPLREFEVGNVATRLFVLWAAVGFVFLLCCLNLANLYTVHGRSRSQEYAVRAALGAGRSRLVRQVLTESALLTSLGGGLGVLIAARAIDWAREGGLRDLPRVHELGLDLGSVGFTAGLSVGTALLFALVATGDPSGASLQPKMSLGRSSRYGSIPLWIQSAQVGITYVLLIGATLLAASFLNLSRVDPGYDPDGLVVIPISPPSPDYDDATSAIDLYDRLIEAVEDLPGVEQAVLTNHGPGGRAGIPAPAAVGGPPDVGSPDAFTVLYRTASPEFFGALRIPLVAGREFTEADLRGPEGPIVINEALARRWGAESALGRTLGVMKAASTREDFGQPLLGRVIGVAADLDPSETGGRPAPTVFVPFAHTPWARVRILARTRTLTISVLSAIQEAIWSVEPALPLSGPFGSVQTMDDLRSSSRQDERFNAWLVGAFALVALLLTTIGMYGVISYTVSLQARAIGVRMALGATAIVVSASMVAKVARVALFGLTLGVFASVLLSRVIESLLFGIQPLAWGVYAGIAVMLFLVALSAGFVPATRAGRLDPLEVIRAE